MCAVTATIAAYFAFIERIGSWLAQHGIPESKARDYIARMFWGLTASAVETPGVSFQSLAGNHATAGRYKRTVHECYRGGTPTSQPPNCRPPLDRRLGL